MRMRYLIFIAIIFSTLATHPVNAEDVNAGFVQGLWYSEEIVFAEVPTRIYVALRNNTDHDLTGTIRFSVDGTRIGSSDVSALSGRLVEAWVDWTPSQGSHDISAIVSNAELHIIGKGTEKIDIKGMVAEDTVFVDIDTDGDGIGNQEDPDDDNDTVSDEDERDRGSDPLVPNPVLVDDDENIEKEDGDVDSSTEDPVSKSDTPSSSENSEQGLERFLSDGAVGGALSGVTQTIENTKESLDSYREERRGSAETENTESDSFAQSSDTATITRSNIEPKVSLLERFITLIGSLLSTIWTVILGIVSFILGFPALLELALLWGILILIYRTAKRFGQRRP